MIAAAKKPLPPPPPPVAAIANLDADDGLILTPGEIKNKHTLETIRFALKGSCPTRVEYTNEILNRARHRRDLAANEVRRFKADEDLEDPRAQKVLATLTRFWGEADRAVASAARRATRAEEETR
jgi:hypothetical protein